jgi:hypothetical protein
MVRRYAEEFEGLTSPEEVQILVEAITDLHERGRSTLSGLPVLPVTLRTRCAHTSSSSRSPNRASGLGRAFPRRLRRACRVAESLGLVGGCECVGLLVECARLLVEHFQPLALRPLLLGRALLLPSLLH